MFKTDAFRYHHVSCPTCKADEDGCPCLGGPDGSYWGLIHAARKRKANLPKHRAAWRKLKRGAA